MSDLPPLACEQLDGFPDCELPTIEAVTVRGERHLYRLVGRDLVRHAYIRGWSHQNTLVDGRLHTPLLLGACRLFCSMNLVEIDLSVQILVNNHEIRTLKPSRSADRWTFERLLYIPADASVKMLGNAPAATTGELSKTMIDAPFHLHIELLGYEMTDAFIPHALQHPNVRPFHEERSS